MIYFIDVDGVLIDNTHFENEVIKTIENYMIYEMKLNKLYAHRIIQQELKKVTNTKDDYSYEVMCNNLGVSDKNVWKNGHHQSVSHLKTYEDAEVFLESKSINSNNKIYFVTDAVKWVLDFKLSSVLFEYKETESFYQENTDSYKGQEKYWNVVHASCILNSKRHDKIMYIDNRIDRLEKASKTFENLTTVHINRKEHLQHFQNDANKFKFKFTPSLVINSLNEIQLQ